MGNKILDVSCIVPARNESGHLRSVIAHVLSVPEIQEIIIVEGGSTDDTWSVAQELALTNPDKIQAFRQVGKGKFDAVLFGARKSVGELIAIWDADGTVSLEHNAAIIRKSIESGLPTMGDRLRGTIAPGAMRPLNWLGNWAFAIAWAPILGSKPRDMLCGTKVLPRKFFITLPEPLLAADPYGDFALIGYARLCDVPVVSHVVDYEARSYGETNIHRWSGGVMLLKATLRIYLDFLVRRSSYLEK